uniref:Thymidine kinase n=1 Tax=Rhodosorus marinus TaxID=101924 RepID=A0A7S0BMC5_9RHOD|mmetsp:Transcript_22777/g.32779  ORF Transcript_22777/g.32779 Transcript_22777/m.32779 type:complete len:265 (+) Transcript_22777:137-931(+)
MDGDIGYVNVISLAFGRHGISPKNCEARGMAFRTLIGRRSLSYMTERIVRPGSASKGGMELIIGPMFAGKTTELLRRSEQRRSAGQRVLLVKSSVDTRYSRVEIVSHDQKREPCYSMKELSPLLSEAIVSDYDVAAIDEAQFFPDLLSFCLEWVDRQKKTVLVAGLDADCERRKFGEVVDLAPHADRITKLSARCGICGEPACFTKRKISLTKEQVLIGGSDLYMAACREHYDMELPVANDCAIESNASFVQEKHIGVQGVARA